MIHESIPILVPRELVHELLPRHVEARHGAAEGPLSIFRAAFTEPSLPDAGLRGSLGIGRVVADGRRSGLGRPRQGTALALEPLVSLVAVYSGSSRRLLHNGRVARPRRVHLQQDGPSLLG